MEDAVDALKIAFAALIFVVALAVFYRMISLAKLTSDEVLYSVNKANYYEYSENGGVENRIVTLKDMIPTIYRYAKEGYGVTIINKSGTIIARFDIETERQVSNLNTPEAYYGTAGKIKESILRKMNKLLLASNNSEITKADLEIILKNIYGIKEETARYRKSQTGLTIDWLGTDGNAVSNENVLSRLEMDIYGFGTAGDHKAICGGNGLLKSGYNYDSKFTEYVLEIDGNTYIHDDGTTNNYNTGESVVTTRGQTKMEIIYVAQKEG